MWPWCHPAFALWQPGEAPPEPRNKQVWKMMDGCQERWSHLDACGLHWFIPELWCSCTGRPLSHYKSGQDQGTDSRVRSVKSVIIRQGFLEQDVFTRFGNGLAALQGRAAGHNRLKIQLNNGRNASLLQASGCDMHKIRFIPNFTLIVMFHGGSRNSPVLVIHSANLSRLI